MNKEEFEGFLIWRNDVIYNAAMDFANLLQRTTLQEMNKDTLPYSQEIAGSIVEAAEGILNSMGIGVCYPYYTDNEQPCYRDTDCKALSKCPFRS